ncbi:hypothetical protein C8R45DRAFT_776350, partial [Mycena sanguinolenta]
RSYSCYSSHQGGSLIRFYMPHNNRTQMETFTGVIDQILQFPLDNMLRTFILVKKFHSLDVEPFTSHPELMAAVVYTEPETDSIVIKPRHIISHLSAWKRPADIYDTDEAVMVICWALNRGRR